jgi:hypothetical protein
MIILWYHAQSTKMKGVLRTQGRTDIAFDQFYLSLKLPLSSHLFIIYIQLFKLYFVVHFWVIAHLGRDADDTASRAATCITRLLALCMATLAEVIRAAVNDDGAL